MKPTRPPGVAQISRSIPAGSSRSAALRARLSLTSVSVVMFALPALQGCKDNGKISAGYAAIHTQFLSDAIVKDVGEVRDGLPAGAVVLGEEWKADPSIDHELNAAKRAIETARRKV